MTHISKIQSTDTIIAIFGCKNMAKKLCIGETAVMNANKRGTFPASWFNVVDGLCAGAGIECPRSLFNFKSPSEVAAE